MNKLLTLTNCSIVTMDEADTYYPNGRLIIENNIIKALGNRDDVDLQGDVYDMSGKVIMPGFVNTHTHSYSPLLRGMADDLGLMEWLKTLLWPAEKHMNSDTAYWGASQTYLEFLESGVTTFADQFYFSKDIAEAAKESGLRAFIAPTVFSDGSPETDDTLLAAVDFVEKYHGKGEETLIYPCIGPHAPYSCNDEIMKEVVAVANKYDLIIHTHISETEDENREIYANKGITPTQYFESLGVFEQKVLAAHCIHLNEKDRAIFRKNKASISYNPISNLKLVSGMLPIKELLADEILVSIGTDGAQSNNSLDLLRDLKTGVLIQKQQYNDATFLPTSESLRMLTINGAKALGVDHIIGSLEKGKNADIIAMDLSQTNISPVHTESKKNVYSAIVYSANGMNVSDVIVNGQWLMKNRLVIRINKKKILSESQRASKYILRKAGLL